MRLSRCHVEYFRQKKQPLPGFAAMVKDYRPAMVVTIDDLVNRHAGIVESPSETAAGRALAILRSARKRGELMLVLERMKNEPGTVINPDLRMKHCAKWYWRIVQEKQRKWMEGFEHG